jgi:hypothetical protein
MQQGRNFTRYFRFLLFCSPLGFYPKIWGEHRPVAQMRAREPMGAGAATVWVGKVSPNHKKVRTVPTEMFILRAISRSPIPAAYPVFICSQVSLVIFRRMSFNNVLTLTGWNSSTFCSIDVHTILKFAARAGMMCLSQQTNSQSLPSSTVWGPTAKKGSGESCNCDLSTQRNADNHLVLIDPKVKTPTMAKDEIRSVTAEFTPGVRLDHPNFNRTRLNNLIRPAGKLLVRVTGLLMFDSKHFFHPDPPVTRDTNWEVHPILKIEYCPEGKTC